jgi:hypothetical protein
MSGREWLGLLVLVGCTPPDATELARSAAAANQILDGGQRSLGVTPGGGVIELVAEAAVQGPDVEFTTVVHSASDGRARMDQGAGRFLGGVGRAGGWYVDADSIRLGDLGPRLEYIRGHELHMMALDPRSRLGNPLFVGVVPLGESLAFAVSLELPGGERFLAYFNTLDTVPVGFVVESQDPVVVVSWADWQEQGGVRLFHEAVLAQGDEEFRYHFGRVELGQVADSLFEPPGR